jgi:16S rRNA (cytosine1402-N4)-methyltransferase
VKNAFKKESRACTCRDLICTCNKTHILKIMTKTPILPTNNEIEENPRSRSAKARLAIKKPL